ncbi:upstream-binding transcription factor [Marchantia polymorpha subsp. ruderalis]|uniref:HMG box domain-containing protein n=2 Tax=Marchantia polymorpha TaxID=3197 RepID=A0A176W6I5_MARPO|nr:hypothetical protein AXG93_312s1070 [Marchantia polymorpha subsp. ruderalis]PTQ43275.1 hypothetical protein MARPO_0026s0138 [Marchantia polymorpha]BBN02046.1 hypothetical protein Mp_2g12330 [Marchantia polymorpha subsp. ruderalis]|eukprot:PTQ43275.1 hypothetical protein MARPO_0026s0138 [Marchantia polymorpha]
MPPRGTRRGAGAKAAAAVAEGNDNEKENVGAAVEAKGPDVSLADELEEMTKKLNMISLEKEKALMLVKEREAQLEQKNAEELRLQGLLSAKEQEQKKLADKVRKLQKMKEFHPTIEVPVSSGAASKEAKKKREAKKDKVKRPMTPFMMWCKEQRHQVKEENPDASFAEMSRLLSEKWKSVSDVEKEPYVERYKIEKDVYLKIIGNEKREVEAMKLFQEEQNKKNAMELLEQYLQFKKDSADDGKKKKKEKDPLKPKKPTSGFFVYANERRPALLAEKMKVTEMGRKLGEEWKALDEQRRQPYEKIAAEDKARYAAELEAYKLKRADELKVAEDQSKEQVKVVKVQALQLLKQKEEIDQVKKNLKDEKLKKKKDKAPVDPNKPKKPPTSYLLFTMENRKLIQQEKPGASFSEINATMAIRWQELPEDQKQVWVEKAAAARDTYKVAIEEYNTKQETSPTS